MAEAAVTWTSSDTSVARVDGAGLVTAADNGTATVAAAAGAASGSAAITVAQVVRTVAVSPPADTIAPGDTVRLVAEALDANGHTVAGTEFFWSSSDTSVARVDETGLVTAADNGTAAVTAAAGAASGSAAITVAQVVRTVVVSPPADTIAPGDTVRLVAEALDANGRRVAGAEFSWSSSDYSITGVDDSGLVQGVGEGIATITAASGAAEGASRIEVVNPDREALIALYRATGGPDWRNSENWLSNAPLRRWYGVDVDRRGRVVQLWLAHNNLAGPLPLELGNLSALGALRLPGNSLTGPIPPELESLSDLQYLYLGQNNLTGPVPHQVGSFSKLESLGLNDNNLTGEIPSEFGKLAGLKDLYLDNNSFSGPIPPELAGLSSLVVLHLQENDLTGPIPGDLGDLSALWRLDLSGNRLTALRPGLGGLDNLAYLLLEDNELAGPLPADLGDLSSLEYLYIADNALTGSLPPEFGRLVRLRQLDVTNNAGLSGALPNSLVALRRLEVFLAAGTGLCASSEATLLDWLEGIPRQRIGPCRRSEMMAHVLTQAVQSDEFPVPLVAGERALLRVFVTAERAGGARIPPVRARFYLDDEETHKVDIPGKTTPIPTAIDEGDLSSSSNAEIPGDIVQPGLEMVLEIDPGGTLDPGLGVAKRIPETGRIAVTVRAVPTMEITLIPFLFGSPPDYAVVDIIAGMAADPDDHELLLETRTLLPVGDLVVTAHEPVVTHSNIAFPLYQEAKAIRVVEGGSGHYMGMMASVAGGAVGTADLSGWSSFAIPASRTIAHELGHNLSLWHAPCGGASVPDPAFPQADGSIGAWGYDFRGSGGLVDPSRRDLMSYCRPHWISPYHFAQALRFRRNPVGVSADRALGRSLLLWGGVGAEGEPYLEPAFVVDAPPALPDSGGEYEIAGRAGSGARLFSLNFNMPEVGDGGGRSSFAFALPVQPGWAGNLASITLTGPGGTVTLDEGADRPMAILRDPRSGQVRAILRDLQTTPTLADAAAALAPSPGLNVLISRGIPGSNAWRR